jgi:hypothetical protein
MSPNNTAKAVAIFLLYLPILVGNIGFQVDDVKPYVRSFEEHLGESVDVDIFFGDLEYGTVGACYYIFIREVVIVDQKWWRYASPTSRKQLIYHELGHCVLDKDHVDEIMHGNGCPVSLMHSYVVSDSCFNEHEHYYLQDLFR